MKDVILRRRTITAENSRREYSSQIGDVMSQELHELIHLFVEMEKIMDEMRSIIDKAVVVASDKN